MATTQAAAANPLAPFHPLVQEWFRRRFAGPTEAQATGWAAVAQGRHTLIAAPTGSGKTLAAFLTCIDGLVRQGLDGGLPETTQVVYVSPLKALSNDIEKNLATPLAEIAALAEERGTPLPEIRAAVRTGDTPAARRQKMAKTPPHILITTPESLYILLTSRSGRRSLAGAQTLILDEIHAVADDKRGSHLSLSVERLGRLAGQPIVRIGLSATQRPIEEVARFLVGTAGVGADGAPDCTIVDTGHTRQIDLAIELPEQELGPIASHDIWGEALDAIAGLVQQHDTTLVFANTRRLVERVSHQLSERLGEEAVVAHHGSLSRSTRLAAEEKLKYGQVKVCVATASLELGIDIGDIDLVCQIGSPRSIGVLLQRIGRSGHTIGGTPKGRVFPMTRDELAECIALARAVRRRNLDTLAIPPWPTDVLAQQIVAECAQQEWGEDELFHLFRGAYPYRDLPREKFDQVIENLAEGYVHRRGRSGAYLHRDGVNRQVQGRRGSPLAAMTSGGAIPDNADYDVIAEPEDTFVGTVNEDFAIESMRGDVFLLGNTAWKIRRVESGRVRVEDAHGQPPSVPFWLGEAPGRTNELSQEVSELREGIDARLDHPAAAQEWVETEAGVAAEAARQLVAYIAEGKRVLGVVPSRNRVVAERFFDESGGMQLVIHSPFGARINRAWGMSLRKKICRNFDFELQAAATDDGLNFSLGPGLSMPVDEVFSYLNPSTLEEVMTQAILQAPLFGTRWRWNATRALAILRHTGGRKVPAPLQRMRSDDLLAAVFPAQVACQDNAPPGDIEIPDHPLVFETVRDCLTEAMDLEGCRALLAAVQDGDIEVYGRDTLQPSVFSHQILNAMPYAFLDDAPLEERRARAVSLRRALPDDARDLARLDPAAIRQEAEYAWPRMRDAAEVHDALLTLGVLPTDISPVAPSAAAADWPTPTNPLIAHWLQELAAAGRAHRISIAAKPAATPGGNHAALSNSNYDATPGGNPVVPSNGYHVAPPAAVAGTPLGRRNSGGAAEWTAWVASERLAVARAAYPDAAIPDAAANTAGAVIPESREEAVQFLVRGWVECIGPFTVGELAATLALPVDDVAYAVAGLENDGIVLRGHYRETAAGPGHNGNAAAGPGKGVAEDEFCDRRILARIHRATINALRSYTEPVSPAVFLRFLAEWQHLAPNARLMGEGGLFSVIEKLQGFEMAAGVIEKEILAPRIIDYSPLALDRLCLGGEVVWGRFSHRSQHSGGHPGGGASANGNGNYNGARRNNGGAHSHNGSPSDNGGARYLRGALSRATPIALALRESLDWLLPAASADGPEPPGAAAEILATLERRGACFLSDLTAATRRLPSDVEETLWTLAAAGRVTADGMEALRQRLNGVHRPRSNGRMPGRGRTLGRGGVSSRPGGSGGRRGLSRWSRLEPVEPVDNPAEALARQLLLRYGIVFPELLARETLPLPWRELVRALRRLEARGEIRGGRFVTGLVGEQFALPEAMDALRLLKGRAPERRLSVISAGDPLNLAGILTPGRRIAALPGHRLALLDGVPIAAVERGGFVELAAAEPAHLNRARALLQVSVDHAAWQLNRAPAMPV